MEVEKIEQLVERLTLKTEAGTLRWREGIRPHTYQVTFPDYAVILEAKPSASGGFLLSEFSMAVLNANGEALVDLTDDHSAGLLAPALGKPVLDRKGMARLYDAARRSATLAGSKAIEGLLERLA